jgi:AraC-like DNA-binding protein
VKALNWTEVALACGYFDQAHFNFRDFTGLSPSDYLHDRVSGRHVAVRLIRFGGHLPKRNYVGRVMVSTLLRSHPQGA